RHRQRRGAAGAGVGRARRPVHEHRPGDAQQPAPQAGRAAADRDRHRRRLRDPVRLSIRTRLALLYGGVFFAMGVVLMAISFAIVDHSLSPAVTTGTFVRYLSTQGPAGLPAPFPPGALPDKPVQILVTQGREAGSTDGPVVGLQGLLSDFRVQTL